LLPGLSCLLHLRRKTALGKGRERCFVRFVIFRCSAVLPAVLVRIASGVVFTFDVVRQGRMNGARPWAAVSLTKRLAITIHPSLVYTITTEDKGLGLMVLRLFSEVTSDELLLSSGQLQPPKSYIYLLSSQVMGKTAQAFRISTCRYM
jgi:hypothetical protein